MTKRRTSKVPPRQGKAPAQHGINAERAGSLPVPVRAKGYVRVSTRGQAERGMSLAAQRDRVTEYAKAKGWQLVGIVEESASGGVRDGEDFSWEHRPVLLDLLGEAQARAFDVLLVAKLDRLSRDYATLTVLERRLQRSAVEVVSTAEENGDGPIAEFIRGQLALIAQLERATILERVSSGKAKKKKLGRHVHGRPPYSYTSSGGILAPVPELAAVVRRVFEDAKAGDSPGRIARALNADNVVPPQRARAWGERAVRLILRNPAYVGERYGVKRAHEPVVSRQLFNAAQRGLDKRAGEWAIKRGAA
jgi:site-specific DNA recombinase